MKTVYPKTAELVFSEFLSFPKIPFEFFGVVNGPGYSHYPGSET
jgi:hypothetical protein